MLGNIHLTMVAPISLTIESSGRRPSVLRMMRFPAMTAILMSTESTDLLPNGAPPLLKLMILTLSPFWKMVLRCTALLFRHVMYGAMVTFPNTSFSLMNALQPTPMVAHGDSTPGTNLRNLREKTSPRRLKTPLQARMSATGRTVNVSSKNAMKIDTSMVRTHAGSNTAGTTVAATSVKNGTQLAVTKKVTGSGLPMTALRVVLSSTMNLLALPMTLPLPSRHGVPTALAMMQSRSTPKFKMVIPTGSTTFGALTKMASRTRANCEKVEEAISE